MRCLALGVATLFVVPAIALGTKTKLDVDDLQKHPFSVPFSAGGHLELHVRSGDVRIVGGHDDKIVVRLSGRRVDEARDLHVRAELSESSGDIHIMGGPKNDVQITVEIPRQTSLFIRMPAGQLQLEDVTGNKDVELHAGELTIDLGDPHDYSRIHASVFSGDLEATPLGESHGGLFRSFTKDGTGKYRLHAHVGAGQLTLR